EAEQRLVRECDVTLVVSPVEQELLAREAPGARIEVLSNVHEVNGLRAPFESRRDLWFVGGFQHPPNVDAVRWFLAEVWPRAESALPGARFHVVGSRMPDELRALADARVEVHGFVEDLGRFLDGCRLSVAPLRYGAGVKGKVNMAMAHGQPVVATPMAVEGMHVVAGEDVLVESDPAAFADAIVRAYSDEALWQRLSRNGLANVERHFSFDAARQALARILPER
ncbi:MAG: glycosyltransferase family 4 protein, partial [Pseudomonadota bacterium]